MLGGADRGRAVARPDAASASRNVTADEGRRRCSTRCSPGIVPPATWCSASSARRHAPSAGTGVPYLDEHPFFAPQKRWVLANCGIIDPTSIDEYIARGGYSALAKALHDDDAGRGLRRGRAERPARPRRRRLPDGQEVEVRAAGRRASRST